MKYLKKIIFAASFAISIILISCAIEIDIPDLNFEPTSDISPTPTPPIITPDPDSAPIFSARNTNPLVFKDKLWVLGGRDSTVDDSCNGAKNFDCYDVWSSANGKDWSLESDSALNFLEEETHDSFFSIVFDGKIVILSEEFSYSSAMIQTADIWTSSNGINWDLVTTDLDFQINSKPLVVGDKIIASLFLHGGSSGLYETTNLKNWDKITTDSQSRSFRFGPFDNLYYHDQTYFVYDASFTPYDPSKPDDPDIFLGYDIYTSPDLLTWTKSDFFPFATRFRLNIINLASKSYFFSLYFDEVLNRLINEIYTDDNPTTANWHKLTQDRDFVFFSGSVIFFKEKFFAISGYDINKNEYLNGVWTWSGIEGEDWQQIR